MGHLIDSTSFKARLTKLGKIENLHSLDSLATETYGTHGRLTYRED